MTSLAERVQTDLIVAMKARDTVTLSTLRLLKTAVKHAEVEKRESLDDIEYLRIIGKQAKMRREAASEYERAGRAQSAEQELSEMAILEQYLPAQMDDDSIRATLRRAIEVTGATSQQQIGAVMSYAMPELRGRADGTRVTVLARELLSGDAH